MRTSMLLAALLSSCTLAQADPPTLIRILRGGPGSVEPYIQAKTQVNVVGAMSISGMPDSWLTELHDSFGSVEDVEKAIAPSTPLDTSPVYSDDVLPASRIWIALYRPNLSHRSDEATKMLPKARYFLFSLYRIRPGGEAGFIDLIRQRRTRFESLNIDRPEIAYQILSGAPAGTYLFLSPLTSLRTLDDALAKSPGYSESYRETSAAAAQRSAADIEIGHENFLLRIDPRMSYVSDDFVSVDPDFWNPKPRNP